MSTEVEVLVQNFLQKKFPNIDADLLNYVVGKIFTNEVTHICFKSIYPKAKDQLLGTVKVLGGHFYFAVAFSKGYLKFWC